jgi:hypothetical protein
MPLLTYAVTGNIEGNGLASPVAMYLDTYSLINLKFPSLQEAAGIQAAGDFYEYIHIASFHL